MVESSQLSVNTESVMVDLDSMSVHGGSCRSLSPGDVFGEMAFFTEIPMMEVRQQASLFEFDL